MDNIITNFHAAWYAMEILLPVFFFGAVTAALLSGAYKRFAQCEFWKSFMIFSVFSAFGITIGMFMGASKSEIVSSLLPPIITLISGYLAYLGSKELPDQVKVLIPGGVFVLLVSLLYAAYYMKAWYIFVSR